MKRYAPNAMELASRDVVSRSEQTEIDEGRGINGVDLLDLRHLGAEKIIERLPGSRELAMTFAGVDPIYEPIPVRPGAHYHMGGVETDNDGLTELTGLYAAGEVRVRLGARRQPSRRQLADGDDHLRPPRRPRRRRVGARQHDDRRARVSAAADAERELKALLEVAARASGPWQIRDELGTSMLENFGVFRREEQMHQARCEILDGLTRALRAASSIEDKGDVFNSDLTQAIELGYMLELAALHARRPGSPARRAAAPTHARTTIPTRDDENFMQHSISRWGDGRPEALLQGGPVHQVQPMERKY